MSKFYEIYNKIISETKIDYKKIESADQIKKMYKAFKTSCIIEFNDYRKARCTWKDFIYHGIKDTVNKHLEEANQNNDVPEGGKPYIEFIDFKVERLSPYFNLKVDTENPYTDEEVEIIKSVMSDYLVDDINKSYGKWQSESDSIGREMTERMKEGKDSGLGS